MSSHRSGTIIAIAALLIALSFATACKTTSEGSGEASGAADTYEIEYELEIPDGVDAKEATARAVEVVRERLAAIETDEKTYRVRSSEPGRFTIAISPYDTQTLDNARNHVDPGPGLRVYPFDVDAARTFVESIDVPDDAWVGQDAHGNPVVGHPERARLESLMRSATADRDVKVGFAHGGSLAPDGDARADDWMAYALVDEPVIDGREVADARVVEPQASNGAVPYYVLVELDESATERFASYTAEHVGGRLAVVVGERVYLVASLDAPIPNGRVQVTLARYDAKGERLSEEASGAEPKT